MVTEPLLDAKGEAHQAEVRTDIAKTLLAWSTTPYGLAGLIVRVGIAVSGMVLAALR